MVSSKPYLDVLETSASVTNSDPSAESPDNGVVFLLYMYEEREMVKAFVWQEATGGFSAIVLATIRTCAFRIAWYRFFADKALETAE
jgi:hypothetical protein